MINRLTPLLSRIVKEAKQQLDENYDQFNTKNWLRVFVTVLMEQYQNVAVLFSRNLENQMGITVTSNERTYIDKVLANYFQKEAAQTAQQLVDATIKNAEFAIKVANEKKEQRLEAGEEVSQREYLAIFGNVFRKRLNGRKKTISMTETQKAAEVSKFVEYEVVETGRTRIEVPGRTTPVTGFKDWYAVLDGKTRPTHVEADRTQRNIPVDQPYKVGKSFMMFPGDRSMGATAKEIINCRCITIYKPKNKG